MPVENLHITLAFIGEIDHGTVEAVDESLAEVSQPAFDIELTGAGHFQEFPQRTVVLVGVSPSEPLTRLRSSVLRRLEVAGVSLPRRRFRPHVTLARIKGDTGHHLANFVAEHNLLRIPAIPMNSFTLFESVLSKEGATHHVIQQYPLRTSEGLEVTESSSAVADG